MVDSVSALALGRDPEKAATTETALALMAILASQPGSEGRRAAAAYHDAGALPVLEGALKASTLLLAASVADGRWVTCVGIPLDEGAVAESR